MVAEQVGPRKSWLVSLGGLRRGMCTHFLYLSAHFPSLSSPDTQNQACLAQSVERQALNLMVVGSSPTVGECFQLQICERTFNSRTYELKSMRLATTIAPRLNAAGHHLYCFGHFYRRFVIIKMPNRLEIDARGFHSPLQINVYYVWVKSCDF